VQDPFPWCLIVDGAAAMEIKPASTRTSRPREANIFNSGFPWPFYSSAEAGWFMRANDYMMGRGL